MWGIVDFELHLPAPGVGVPLDLNWYCYHSNFNTGSYIATQLAKTLEPKQEVSWGKARASFPSMGFYLHLFKDEAVSLPEFVAIDEKKLTSNLSECSLATIYI